MYRLKVTSTENNSSGNGLKNFCSTKYNNWYRILADVYSVKTYVGGTLLYIVVNVYPPYMPKIRIVTSC